MNQCLRPHWPTGQPSPRATLAYATRAWKPEISLPFTSLSPLLSSPLLLAALPLPAPSWRFGRFWRPRSKSCVHGQGGCGQPCPRPLSLPGTSGTSARAVRGSEVGRVGHWGHWPVGWLAGWPPGWLARQAAQRASGRADVRNSVAYRRLKIASASPASACQTKFPPDAKLSRTLARWPILRPLGPGRVDGGKGQGYCRPRWPLVCSAKGSAAAAIRRHWPAATIEWPS